MSGKQWIFVQTDESSQEQSYSKIYKGVEISLTDDMRFSAVIGGRRITRSSVVTLERLIDKDQPAIMAIQAYSKGVRSTICRTLMIKRIEKGRYRLDSDGQGTGSLLRRGVVAYEYDENIEARLKQIQEQIHDLQSESDRLIDGLTIVNQDSFNITRGSANE